MDWASSAWACTYGYKSHKTQRGALPIAGMEPFRKSIASSIFRSPFMLQFSSLPFSRLNSIRPK